MKYLLVSIINIIYGVLMLLTLDTTTPGFTIVLVIGFVLTILGLIGFVLWMKITLRAVKEIPPDETAIKNWFNLAKSFDLVLIIGLLFRAVVIQPYVVEGSSMEPNFHDKEIILVDKMSYRFRPVHRGETIIFKAPTNPREDYIKRIIAFPGETVVIEKGKISINGRPLQEPYIGDIKTITSDKVFRQTLGPEQYFVMGDNRNNSSDSREWGPLPKVNIIGRAWIVITPLDQKGIIHYPEPSFGT